MRKWLLIYSKPRQETLAALNLERQGFSVYNPVIQVSEKSSRIPRRKLVEPLFPRYLFIHVDPHCQSISPVRSTQGVSSFVKFGDNFAAAPQKIIDQIQRRTSSHVSCEVVKPGFKQGDKVKVSRNGFKDVNALFSSTDGDERAFILLDILGKQSRMSVPLECIAGE